MGGGGSQKGGPSTPPEKPAPSPVEPIDPEAKDQTSSQTDSRSTQQKAAAVKSGTYYSNKAGTFGAASTPQGGSVYSKTFGGR